MTIDSHDKDADRTDHVQRLIDEADDITAAASNEAARADAQLRRRDRRVAMTLTLVFGFVAALAAIVWAVAS